MSADRKPLSIDAVELADDEAPFPKDPPREIDTAARRLESWAAAAIGGSTNVINVAGVSYSWDAHPRKLQNGALQGRVYAQRRGELPHDIGGFKVDARGRVVHLPRELAGVLPGAEASTSEANEPTGDQS